jgi:hypothetical protein
MIVSKSSTLFNTDGLIFSDTGIPAVLFMEDVMVVVILSGLLLVGCRLL